MRTVTRTMTELARTRAAALFVVGLTLIAPPTHAQTTTPNTNPSTTAQTPKDTRTDDEKALDEMLLGIWSNVPFSRQSGLVTKKAMEDAVRGCITVARVLQLQFQDGAEKTQPNIKALRGSVVYWRTKVGIQRLHIPTRRVFVYGSYEKRQQANGRHLHLLKGKNVGVALRFGRPAKAQLMMENDSVLLKCPPLPNRNQQSN